MARIHIRRTHRRSVCALRRVAEDVARRIEQRHAVTWRWHGDTMELTAPPGLASGAFGRVAIGDDDVAIEIQLPLVFAPARAMVERTVAAKLDSILAA